MELLIIGVIALLAIAGATALGPRVRVAAPLILVVLGIGVSLVPAVPAVVVEPEWVLAGILPPLLYSASVSMPAMEFRREFGAIGGLSVALVVVSSVILGGFFALVIPDLGLAWGIALGAVVSPTDAVATSIVKRIGVTPRVVAVLEGESLLNDATALVVLRAAIAGAAVSVSFGGVLGQFALAVVVAVAIGVVVGKVKLWVRSRVSDAPVNTVLSFTVPFLASIPAELLHGSGLVAAVVAGLVTGRGAARVLPARHRLSDAQVWRSAELVLEGAIFLLMGLQLDGIVDRVRTDHAGFGFAAAVAAGALLLTILVRSAYVAPLLVVLSRRNRRRADGKDRIAAVQARLAQTSEVGMEEREDAQIQFIRSRQGRLKPPSERRMEQFRTRVRRYVADVDYFLAQPLGPREGVVIVWAGMRGAVTLAAAQTLPEDAPSRSLLVLIAFLVAGGSLLLQGGTLGWVIRTARPATVDASVAVEERTRMMQLLNDTSATVDSELEVVDPYARTKVQALAVIAAQRDALLDARDDGVFSAGVLTSALTTLDADQIRLELRGGPTG